MKKFIVLLFFIFFIFSSLKSNAQSAIKLSYGAGAQYNFNTFGFKYEFQKRENEIFELKDNISPYLFIDISDRNKIFPLSFGAKISCLDFQGVYTRLTTQGYDIFGYPFNDDFKYQFHNRWIQLQLPVKFNYSFKTSELSLAYVSGIYFNSKKHYRFIDNNSPPTMGFLGSSNAIAHQSPDDINLSADLSIGYTYFLSSLGNKRLGLQAFMSYPLFCPIVTGISKTYSYLSYSLQDYEFTTSRRIAAKPISFGLVLVFK